MTNLLQTVGIEMPPGFPSEVVWSIHERVTAAIQVKQQVAWTEFGGGWNGLAYRLRACADDSARFADSVREHGVSPAHDERYRQEAALFGFFVSGLSSIESFSYGLHALGWMLHPSAGTFSMATDDARRNVKPARTRALFEHNYRSEAITERLGEVLNSREFAGWSELRNILAHRSSPGRAFDLHLGGCEEAALKADWSELPIRPELTEERLQWLIETVSDLLDAAKEFVFANVVLAESD